MNIKFEMDSTYTDLANRILRLLERSNSYRILILLIGAPGSGKSTIAQRVVDILNERHIQYNQSAKKGKKPNIDGHFQSEVNTKLPSYDESVEIDVEDENYTPTLNVIDQTTSIIRSRGGDDTAIKIQKSTGVESSIDQFAQVVPMDGFHLPRRVLHQFKDSKTAIARRGSPFTFDSSLIVQLVENINETLQIKAEGIDPLETAISDIPDIYIPSFNHAEHDPKQFGTVIHSSSRVLIMEGLYLLLNEPVWERIPRILHPNIEFEPIINTKSHNFNKIDDVEVPKGKNYELWKIITDEDTMLYRVGKRHLNAGIVKTLKEGEDRVKFNDLPNGKLVYAKSFKSDLNIFSIDDENESVL